MSASAAAVSTGDYARKIVTALHTALSERLELERQAQRSTKQGGAQASGNELCVLPQLFLLNNLYYMVKSIKEEEGNGEQEMPAAIPVYCGGTEDEEEMEEEEKEDEHKSRTDGVQRARTLAELIGDSQIE
jgi:hypothetical protein